MPGGGGGSSVGIAITGEGGYAGSGGGWSIGIANGGSLVEATGNTFDLGEPGAGGRDEDAPELTYGRDGSAVEMYD